MGVKLGLSNYFYFVCFKTWTCPDEARLLVHARAHGPGIIDVCQADAQSNWKT